MSMKELEIDSKTRKRFRFIDEYMIDFNATQAALRAGYAPSKCELRGMKFLRVDWIQAEIQRRTDCLKSSKIADAQEVLEMLTAVARGQEVEECVVVEGIGKGYSKASIINKVVVPKDKLKAMELLGKAHQMFIDRVEFDKAPQIIDDIIDKDEK